MKLSTIKQILESSSPMTNVEVKWAPFDKGSLRKLLDSASEELKSHGFESLAESLDDLYAPYVEPEEVVTTVSSLVKIYADIDIDVTAKLEAPSEDMSPSEIVLREARSLKPGDKFTARNGDQNLYICKSNNGALIVGDDTQTSIPWIKSFPYSELVQRKFAIVERAPQKSPPKMKIQRRKAEGGTHITLSLSQHIALMAGSSLLSLLVAAGLVAIFAS